jgi:hypothetical protein
MNLISKPETADNSENSLTCSQCGNTILIGSEDGTDQQLAECDICHNLQLIDPGKVHGSSNEDY